ncbi:MAG: hypothetical protein NZ742_11535 [Acidobacteria bacterium]|nr:hypothetical protein [Acidobacteriota bacterium]MDW7985318.1 hypothetical protein [Acidobacteriota bacterium]
MRYSRWTVLAFALAGLLGVRDAWPAEGFRRGLQAFVGGGAVRSVAADTATGGSAHAGVLVPMSDVFAGLVLLEVAPFSSHAGSPLGEGTFRIQMVTAALVFRPLAGAWSPLLIAGGLYQASAFSIRDPAAFAAVGLDIRTSSPEATPGVWGGVGLDYRVSDRISLWVWGRKAFLRTKLRIQVADRVTGLAFEAKTDSISLDPWWLQGSLVLRF